MFVLSSKRMMPSARVLAGALSEATHSAVKVTSKTETRLRGNFISWGRWSGLPSSGVSINNTGYIRTAANKELFSRCMVESGIDTVELHRQSTPPEMYPVVVRSTVTGYGGNGILIARNQNEWARLSNHPFSYFRNFSIELGVHVFNGRIIKLFKKIKTDGEANEEFPIRNSSRGYDFSLVDIRNFPKLVPFVENFLQKFPIMFGRMDVGWDTNDKLYRVIEFNTAPCLTNNKDTLSRYVSSFVEIMR